MLFQPADLARAAGLRLAAISRLPGAAQLRQHAVEGGDADAGEAMKTGAAAQPGGGERGGHGGGSFATKESYESYRPVVGESQFSAGMREGGGNFRNRSIIELSDFPELPLYSAFNLPNRLRSTSSKRKSFSESKRAWPQYFSVFSMSLL